MLNGAEHQLLPVAGVFIFTKSSGILYYIISELPAESSFAATAAFPIRHEGKRTESSGMCCVAYHILYTIVICHINRVLLNFCYCVLYNRVLCLRCGGQRMGLGDTP